MSLTSQLELVRQPPRLIKKSAVGYPSSTALFPVPPTSESVRCILTTAAQELSCVICFDILQDPVFLECRHGFCRGCITRMIENAESSSDNKKKSPQSSKEKQRCPLCKAPTQSRSLLSSSPLSAIIETISRISELSGVDDMSDTQQVSGVHSQAFALHYSHVSGSGGMGGGSSGDIIEVSGPSYMSAPSPFLPSAASPSSSNNRAQQQPNGGGDPFGSPTTSLATRLAQSLMVNSGSGNRAAQDSSPSSQQLGTKRQRDDEKEEATKAAHNNDEYFSPTPIADAETISQLHGGGAAASYAAATARHITFQLTASVSSSLNAASGSGSASQHHIDTAAENDDDAKSIISSNSAHTDGEVLFPQSESISTTSADPITTTAVEDEMNVSGGSRKYDLFEDLFGKDTHNVGDDDADDEPMASQKTTLDPGAASSLLSINGGNTMNSGGSSSITPLGGGSAGVGGEASSISSVAPSSSLVAPLHHSANSLHLTLTPPRWREHQGDSDSDNSNSWTGMSRYQQNGGGSSSFSTTHHPAVELSSSMAAKYPAPPPLPPLYNKHTTKTQSQQHHNYCPIDSEEGGGGDVSAIVTPPLSVASSSMSVGGGGIQAQQIRGVVTSPSDGILLRSNSSSSVTELQQRHRPGTTATTSYNVSPPSVDTPSQDAPSLSSPVGATPSSSSTIIIPATQVLATRRMPPPPPRHPATPPPPPHPASFFGVSVKVNEAAYSGRCALCGLDTANRAQMRKFLRSILAKDPTCCRADIIGLSEQAARTLFGPLVECPPPPTTPSPTLFRSSHSQAAQSGGCDNTLSQCHELCLLWTPDIAVNLDDGNFDKNNNSMSRTSATPQYVGVNESLDAAHQRRCGFCGELGASFSPAGTSPYFHIPCALLTGDGVCIVDNSGHDDEQQ